MSGCNQWKIVWFLVLLLAAAVPASTAKAKEKDPAESEGWNQENLDSMVEYDEIQKIVDQSIGEQESFDFQSFVKKVFLSEGKYQLTDLLHDLWDHLKKELFGEKGTLLRFLGIALTGAVFTNFSRVFENRQAAETGFYISYLLLFMLLATTFYSLTSIASAALDSVLDFMKALVPSYFTVMAFSSGAGTSAVFYEAALLLITLLENLIYYIVFPMIHVFFLLSLADHMAEEDILSKLLDLLEGVIRFLLNTILGITAGYHVIQSLVMPAVDQLKQGAVMKAMRMLPGLGSAAGTVTETVFGAGMVLKNAIGLAAVLVILMILMLPMIKIGTMVFFYRFAAAVIQPAADKRIVEAMQGAYRSGSLLIRTVLTAGILFLLTLAVTMSVKTIF